MRNDTMHENLKNELELQSKLLEECEKKETSQKKGYLFVRKSGDHKLYYQATKTKTEEGWKTSLKNISSKPKLIRELAQKAINKKLKTVYRKNIATLTKALKNYIPLDEDILRPAKFREVFNEVKLPVHYEQCLFDPEVHIHPTICGIMVRSKAEVIIANALWHYGIPFNYEELFPYPSDNGDLFYPDFTIHLPNGKILIWEHFGLLSELSYCISNAYKLHTFQNAGFTIGENLIITQDDIKGSCNSAIIYHIIENYILPYFK